MPRAAFSQIANRSMSEVLTRSLATSLCTALPILALMLFGGETLRDFAFALLIGVISGAYSSVFIATPVLTAWKEREPVYEARRERIEAANGGIVPPYALATVGGDPVDVEPERKDAAPRRRLTEPDEPRELSREEFEALQRDLDVDDEAAVTPPRRGRAAAVVPPPASDAAPKASPKPSKPAPAEREANGRAPDEPENDGMEGRADRAPADEAAERRHRLQESRSPPCGASVGAMALPLHPLRPCLPAELAVQAVPSRGEPLMGMLAWVMMGLAIWHFTIFLPDRFWGGIVGAFLGALFGAILFGLAINGFTVPGQDDTHLLTALEGIPGAMIGLGLVYAEGIRRERLYAEPA